MDASSEPMLRTRPTTSSGCGGMTEKWASSTSFTASRTRRLPRPVAGRPFASGGAGLAWIGSIPYLRAPSNRAYARDADRPANVTARAWCASVPDCSRGPCIAHKSKRRRSHSKTPSAASAPRTAAIATGVETEWRATHQWAKAHPTTIARRRRAESTSPNEGRRSTESRVRSVSRGLTAIDCDARQVRARGRRGRLGDRPLTRTAFR